jgi:hypothetical protein
MYQDRGRRLLYGVMPIATRPTAGDPFSTRAGTLLHDPLTLVAAPAATVMEEDLPGTRLSPPEPHALSFSTVAMVMGVKWRHGWQPCEPAHGADGLALAASLLFRASPAPEGLPR